LAIPEHITQVIQDLDIDVKAEVIAYQLHSNGFMWNEMFYHTDHFFHRNYSKDIHLSKVEEGRNKKSLLHVHLSRSGMYDILPEGLFFQPANYKNKAITAFDMAVEYRENKKEEQEVRKFFSPLENEFFYHKYKNFISEKQTIEGLSKGTLNNYFKRFWNLPQDMKAACVLRMTLLMPYIHQIAGDTNLMAQSLKEIIQEEVTCHIGKETIPAFYASPNQLGMYTLGNELVCGDYFFEEEHVFVFTIHVDKHSSSQKYIQNGVMYSTLQIFYDYFVPVNAEIKTKIKVDATFEHMMIGDCEESVLGIATVI
jgi:hypothetical protein